MSDPLMKTEQEIRAKRYEQASKRKSRTIESEEKTWMNPHGTTRNRSCECSGNWVRFLVLVILSPLLLGRKGQAGRPNQMLEWLIEGCHQASQQVIYGLHRKRSR